MAEQYQGFPHISHFEQFVRDEFENRELGRKFVGGITTRYDFLDRTPFISMISGLSKIDKYKMKTRYILTNTEILVKQINDVDSEDEYKSFRSYNQEYDKFYNKQTFRPYDGITDISVSYKNKFGSVRNATINWICNSKEKLQELSPFFLTVGHSIFLEWGWSGEGSNYSQIYNIDSNINDFKVGVAAKNIYNLISSSNGNYDAMVGIVTNYDFKINKDFTYNCVTEISSQGFIMPSLQVDALSINTTSVQNTAVEAPKPKYLLNFKSYLESGKYYQDIAKYYSLIEKGDGIDPDWMVGVDTPFRIQQYAETIAYKASQKNTENVTMYDFSPERYPMYISWGLIEDVILGNNYNVVAKKDDPNSKVELSSLNSTYQYVSFKNLLRSTDLYKCIIPVKNVGKLNVELLTSELDLQNAARIKEIDKEIQQKKQNIQVKSNLKTKDIFYSYFRKHNPPYDIIPDELVEIFKMDIKDNKYQVCIPQMDMLYKYFDFKFKENSTKVSYSFIDSIFVEITVGVNFFIPPYRITKDSTENDVKKLFLELNMPVKYIFKKKYPNKNRVDVYTILYEIKVSNGLKDNNDNLNVYIKNYIEVMKRINTIFSHFYNKWNNIERYYDNKTSTVESKTKHGQRDFDDISYDLKLCRMYVSYGINTVLTDKILGMIPKMKIFAPLHYKHNIYASKGININLYDFFNNYLTEYKNAIIGNLAFIKKNDGDKNISITGIMDYFYKYKNFNMYIYSPDENKQCILKPFIFEYFDGDNYNENNLYKTKEDTYNLISITDKNYHDELKLKYPNDEYKEIWNDVIKDWEDLNNKMSDMFNDNAADLESIAKLEDEKSAIEAKTITEADLTTIPEGYVKMSEFSFNGEIRRIMVNAEFFRQTMFESDYVIDGILSVLNAISEACGNYFNFIVSHNDLRSYKDIDKFPNRKNISTSWYVCDMQSSKINNSTLDEIKSAYTFSVFAIDFENKKEKNPFLHKFSISTKISKEASLNTFYSIQTGEQNNVVHGANLENTFYSLYKFKMGEDINYRDIFIGNKLGTESNSSMKSLYNVMEQSRQDILKLHKNLLDTEYLYVYLPLVGSGYNYLVYSTEYKDTMVKNIIYLDGKEGMNMGLYGRFNDGYDRYSLVPMEASIEMQGISGIRISDVFNLDYIPEIYKTNGVFHVLDITQTVNKQNWVTKIGGMYRTLNPFKTLAKVGITEESNTDGK